MTLTQYIDRIMNGKVIFSESWMIVHHLVLTHWKSAVWFIHYQQLKFRHDLKEFHYLVDLVVTSGLSKHSL